MNFACPTCDITLQAEPDLAGKTVKCPGCSSRIQIPEDFGPPPPTGADHEHAAEDMADEHYDQIPELDVSTAISKVHPSFVNVWIGGGVGIAATFLWFLIMYLLPVRESVEIPHNAGSYFRELFTQRGWPQYVTTLLMFWCLAILVLKWINIQKQRRAMLIQALPTDISDEINPANLKAFHDHIINFPKPLRNTYIVNRIRKALEFFYVRQNNPDVAQMITAQSEIDAAKVSSSYSMVKVFLWAIPIMGFIGTVLGIGAAIGGFGAVFGAGEGGDMSEIKEPLLNVLNSMGVAFDTTLLALVFSILLSFPASALQNQEDDLVTDVDEYCIDHLLKRLNDGGAASNFGSDAGLLKAVGEAMAANQQDIMHRFESVQTGMSNSLGNQTKQYERVAEAVEKQIAAIDERADKYGSKLDRSLDSQVASLAEGIKNLNTVLKELNGKQVVVEKVGWFGRRKKADPVEDEA